MRLCNIELEAATRLSSQLEDNKQKGTRKAIEAVDGGKGYERTKRTHL